MYLPGFPAIAAEFGTSYNLVQYTVTAFLAGLAIGQMLYGPLSDRVGRKLPLSIGIAIYVAASIGCALANTIEVLIAWRFLQGAGGCAGVVIGRAMVRDRFGATESAKVFSLMMLVVAVAPMVAPLIGGWMTALGWRTIFDTLAAFGVLLAIGVVRSVDETLPIERRTHGGAHVFARYWALLRSRQLVSYTVVAGLMQSALYAYVVCAPFVVMEVYGVRPQYFGLVFFGNTAGLIVASQINAAIVARFGPDRILGIALLWPVSLSILLVGSLLLGWTSIYVVLAVLFGYLVGHGFISPNAAALGLSKHSAQAGTASAVMGAIQFGLGIATISIASFFKQNSALPLALVMGACSCLALVCHRLAARPTLERG
ncbi:multidrug transporter [Burkholderia thailandensis]|nr:multidrug transporter [Burkholderia thailandensis]